MHDRHVHESEQHLSGGDTYRDFGIKALQSTGLLLVGHWATSAALLAADGPQVPDATVIGRTVEQLRPDLDHDDIMDASSGAYNSLTHQEAEGGFLF